MIYEISNPSDPYTIQGENFQIVAIAACILGNGAYGLLNEDGSRAMPIFLFGGHDEWFTEKFGKTFEEAVNETDDLELAEVLQSVVIGSFAARREFEHAMELIKDPNDRSLFRAKRHDERRSSMNDIGRRADRMATALREKAAA